MPMLENIDDDVQTAMLEILSRTVDGALRECDLFLLESTARLLIWSRQPGARIGVFTALSANLSKMGCTPSDRARMPVTAPPEDDADNPWIQFLPEKQKAERVVRSLFGDKQPLAAVTKAQLAAKIRARGGFPAEPGDAALLEHSAESILEMAGLDAGPEDDGATETEHTGESPDAYMQ